MDTSTYPYVSLDEALIAGRKMYLYTKKAAAPVNSIVVDVWGFTQTSSRGGRVLGALRAFGLLEHASSSKGKMIKLSASALLLLLDEESPRRADALKAAALAPKLYALCWKHWGAEMPPSMRSTLLLEGDFTEVTVDQFLRNYKKTIEYAGLLVSDTSSAIVNNSGPTSSRLLFGDVAFEVSEMPTRELNLERSEGANYNNTSKQEDFRFVPLPQIEQAEDHLHSPSPLSGASCVDEFATANKDLISLPDGRVILQYPATLSVESYQVICQWLEVMKRNLGRFVVEPSGA